MWVPFLRSFPGNEAHKLFSRAPKVGVLGGMQKVYVEKVYVLFPSLNYSWAHNLLYRSRPDLDQYAQGVVHNARTLCYHVEDASYGAL